MVHRAAIAEEGQLPPYKEDRLMWVHIFYDWETRRKRVFENGMLNPETFPEDKDLGRNEHYYKLQVVLPAPIAERTENELPIEVRPEHLTEMTARKGLTPGKGLDWEMARWIFYRINQILPTPVDFKDTCGYVGFGGKGADGDWDFSKPEVHVSGPNGSKYRITVEKIEP